MEASEKGLHSTSTHYFSFVSPRAQEMLFYFSSVGKFDCTTQYRVNRLDFNSFLMIVMLRGQLRYQYKDCEPLVSEGQILLLDCHKPHRYYAVSDCSFAFMHFDGANSRQLVDAILKQNGPVSIPQTITPFLQTLMGFMDELGQRKRINEIDASMKVYSMLIGLFETPKALGYGDDERARIDSVVEYIMNHLEEALSIEELAALCGYSASYFSRAFRKVTDLAPYQFILHARIDRAMYLLNTTAIPVSRIAASIGFASGANFSYAFRRATGYTPSEFRKLQF